MIELAWWVWLFGLLGALLIGAAGAGAVYMINAMIKNRKMKKGLPKDKKELSEYLKQDDASKVMANPGHAKQYDIKEVEENDRREFESYREFEKLRRIEQGKPAAFSIPKDARTTGAIQEPGVLQNGINLESSKPKQESEYYKSGIDLD